MVGHLLSRTHYPRKKIVRLVASELGVTFKSSSGAQTPPPSPYYRMSCTDSNPNDNPSKRAEGAGESIKKGVVIAEDDVNAGDPAVAVVAASSTATARHQAHRRGSYSAAPHIRVSFDGHRVVYGSDVIILPQIESFPRGQQVMAHCPIVRSPPIIQTILFRKLT